MKHFFLTAATLAASIQISSGATLVSPTGTSEIPGAGTFAYDVYYVLGDDHSAEWSDHTDAYAWDNPSLAQSDPERTGWTHLSYWVAFTLTAPAKLTVSLESTDGIMFLDNTSGQMVAAGNDLIPAFTLWEGIEEAAESSGHRWDNDGDLTTWADQISYVGHDGNLSGAALAQQTYSLAAGNYTMNIAGHKPGAFDPGTEPGDLEKGFAATLSTTAIPEPGSGLLALLGFVFPMLRRRRR